MAAGAMFGDLEKYLDPGFFEENRTGQLLTPEYDYDIVVFASGIFNAYDRNVYSAGNTVPVGYITDNSVNIRDAGSLQHVLVLSTCLDEMTDNRAVVFCALSNRRAHS
jgi:sortase B